MKNHPVRQCMACRERFLKHELLRVVRPSAADAPAVLDKTGKTPGRGAYLCKSAVCLKRVRKSRALERMLKAGIPEDVYSEIEAIIGEASGGKDR